MQEKNPACINLPSKFSLDVDLDLGKRAAIPAALVLEAYRDRDLQAAARLTSLLDR